MKHAHHFPPPSATIDTVIHWTDFRGREYDADCVARYELRDGRPFITAWTLDTSRYVPDDLIEEQLYDAIDDAGFLPAEAYLPGRMGL